MGSGFDNNTDVVKHRTKQVSNNVSRASFEQWVAPRMQKARQIRLLCFGKLKMFMLYTSITFRQVQEGHELVQENAPGTILVVLRSTPW